MASWPRRNLSLQQLVDWRPRQGCLVQVKSRVLMNGMWPFFHGMVRPLETLLTWHLAHCRHQLELPQLSVSGGTEKENQEKCYQPGICEQSQPVPLALGTPCWSSPQVWNKIWKQEGGASKEKTDLPTQPRI